MVKKIVEDYVDDIGLSIPSPVDATTSMLVVAKDGQYNLHKHELELNLDAADILQEVQSYIVPGSGGVKIRSLSPVGLLALRFLEPRCPEDGIRPDHKEMDTMLMKWFYNNGVKLPKPFQNSVDEFRQRYNEAYPYRPLYLKFRKLYHGLTPEVVRNILKPVTRAMRLKFTGERI